MKKNTSRLILLFIIICSMPITLTGQDRRIFDITGYKRNVIKWNLTPFLLWDSKNINLSYERILSPYRSFSANAGYFVMPTIGIRDSLNIKAARSNSGFSLSGDYRFYIKKQNAGFAPQGVYFGIFSSFHHYQFQNDVEIINNPNIQGSLFLDGHYNILGLGLELGYQFVIRERFTVDLIFMGPSTSLYSAKLNLGGSITSEEYNDYLEAIRDILISQFPFLDELITEGTFSTSGNINTWGFGLRYMIQIGYRF